MGHDTRAEQQIELYELRNIVNLALDIIAAEETIVEAEICASWCEQRMVGMQYDAAHPDEGLQALRVLTTWGLGIVLVLEKGGERRIGFGSASEDLSHDGIMMALDIAKNSALPDPLYRALPKPVAAAPLATLLYDANVMEMPDEDIITLAGEALDGALSTFKEAGYVIHTQVTGEVRSHIGLMVVGNSHGVLASDTTTALLATVHGHLLPEQSRGSSRQSATHMRDFLAYEAGVEAAQRALQARGGIVLPGGPYPVIFGPQAVADLLQDLLLPALSLDAVMAGVSPFATQRGQLVANALLTMTDNGRLPGMLGSRAITGEGLPTGTTTLIAAGRLEGFLADVYHAQALADQVGLLAPHHGMRHATDGQPFAMRPGIFPTNVTLTSPDAVPLEELLAPITEGIYVGALWYTLPQGGRHTGAFTSTVIGPSFHIQQGQLTQPIQPGTLRLQDNVGALLQGLTGLSTTRRPIPLATQQSVVVAPELRCSAAYFTA